ncbi:DUF262 domain-containing protein [Bosea sp. NPDC003192]|uniref:DUF262 domain-containing protein n=1 Tax=Bosea sp. NPDC003192 TaxID=3390551 RepID=UPI003D00EA33
MQESPDDEELNFLDPRSDSGSSKKEPEIAAAEAQIIQNIKDVRYIVREYPISVVVSMFLNGLEDDKNEIFIPDYQRDLIWPDKNQSRFVESLLIGLPVPFIFVADANAIDEPDKAGRLEIVDGVQRIRTLVRFLTGDLVLSDLEKLPLLNDFTFHDLPPSRQRRFKRVTLRLIELTETVGEDVRRDMFDRINTGSVGLEAVEVRRGMRPGPFLDLVSVLAKDPALHSLAPVSTALQKRFEYEELVTRFFAFLDRYENYGRGPEGKVVKDFLMSYVLDTNAELASDGGTAKREVMEAEWHRMLAFIGKNFPGGFKKAGPGRKVPRVRFEALAVGVALALREDPNLVPSDVSWLNGEEFKKRTTTDASNNRSNLVGRLEFVRDRLLGR